MIKYLVQIDPEFKPTNRPTGDGYYWIEGEAIIREKMWPYKHRERVKFHDSLDYQQIPYFIQGGLIDMGNDVAIPVEWVTAKAKFYGPIVFIAPWRNREQK